jgi:Spy/CpxP family protein refolding chaperone
VPLSEGVTLRPSRASIRGLLATLLGCAALTPFPATAEPGGPPPFGGPRGPAPIERALESIDLPADVRVQIDALLDASHSQRRVVHRELRKAHAEMKALLEAEEPEEATILSQADRIGELQTALEKDRLSTLLRIRALLTPEQRDALTRALEARGEGRRGRLPPPH